MGTIKDVRRAVRARFAGLEPLERRALLAADLSGAWTGLDLLPAVFSGQTVPPVTLHVQNNSIDTASASGAVVDIYLSDDDTLDTQADTKVATAKLGKLNPMAFKDLVFKKIKLSPGMDAGDIFLFAKIDTTDKVAEDDETNNTAAGAAIVVTQPDYDLSGATATPKLNLSLVQGVISKGTVKLTLTNNGTIKIPSAAKININFFLRPAANANDDASGDIAIGSLVNQAAALAGGASKAYTGKLTLDAAIASGQYRIVTVIDTLDALAETDETNNTVIGSEVFTLSPAFADLGITGGSYTAPGTIPAGAKIVVSITVFNAGNVAATGTVGVALVAKASGYADVPLASVSSIPFTAKAGFSKTVKVPFTVPLLLIDGVLYDVEITITPVTTVGGDDAGNNVAVVGSGFTPSIPTINAPIIGDLVVFSGETAGSGDGVNGVSQKIGNFVDGNGRHGTYSYSNNNATPFETGILGLQWTDGQQPSYQAFYLYYGNEGGPSALKGKKLKVYNYTDHEAIGQISDGVNILGFVSVG
ncbi:MAG: hypothetical protein K8S99_16360 [Planctomycetes bacterium]|nr:hypothetical protein [Planctomycetota bacterium]